MRHLWFKARFVEAILAGEKRDTIRARSSRLPTEGSIVALSVGPRRPFAFARIIAIESAAEVMPDRMASATACLGDRARDDLALIRFRLVDAGAS